MYFASNGVKIKKNKQQKNQKKKTLVQSQQNKCIEFMNIKSSNI